MEHEPSLPEFGRRILIGQKKLFDALNASGMADAANLLAGLTDSTLKLLATMVGIKEEKAELERRLSNRDAVIERLSEKISALTEEIEKLKTEMEQVESRRQGRAELENIFGYLGALNIEFRELEEAQRLVHAIAEAHVRLSQMSAENRLMAQQMIDYLLAIVEKDSDLWKKLKQLEEEEDGD